MIKHFREIHRLMNRFGPARLAVVNPQHPHLQYILKKSTHKGFIEPLLFINDDPTIAAREAIEAVASGKADLLMKGNIDTATLLSIILNKEYGLRTDKLLSHISVIETPFYNRFMLCSDGGININLNEDTVSGIIENALSLATNLTIQKPNVAFLSLVETITPKLPSTKLWKKMTQKYLTDNRLTTEGPIALDIALSAIAAERKSVESKIDGKTDIFIGPTITSINMMVKALINVGGARGGSIILGAKCPIILLSRSETRRTKMNSITLGLLALNRS